MHEQTRRTIHADHWISVEVGDATTQGLLTACIQNARSEWLRWPRLLINEANSAWKW
jgi:hypothetical protein